MIGRTPAGVAIRTALGIFESPGLPALAQGMPASLVLRPDSIVAGDGGEVRAAVRHVAFAGGGYAVEAEAQGQALRFMAAEPPAVGAAVALSILGERAYVTAPL